MPALKIMLGEIRASSVPLDVSCDHRSHWPIFNAEACRGVALEDIRKRYPRYHGPCQACKQQIILYASQEHYEACQGWAWAVAG